MANTLFNRNIRFVLDTLGPNQTDGLLRTSTFERTPIQVSLSKSRNINVENTGIVTITNIKIENVKAFSSVTSPYRLRYKLFVGYGQERPLPLLSEGYITEVTWEHEGGDIRSTFTITEGSKQAKLPYDIAGNLISIPKGASVAGLIEQLEARGQNFRFLPNRRRVLRDLSVIKTPASKVITNVNRALVYSLDEAGYTFYQENTRIVIRKKSTPSTPDSFLLPDQNVKTILNFKTGLLSADVENTFDYQTNIKLAFVKFVSLFIPELQPSNALRIDEKRYSHIVGDYIIDNVEYSLHNKQGNFQASGRAFHFNFKNPATDGKTIIQIEREAGIRR